MAGTERPRTWYLWITTCAVPAAFLVSVFFAGNLPLWADIVTVILLVGTVVSTWWQVRGIKRKAAADHRVS